MVGMDELRILVGLPLTTEEERAFGSSCVATNSQASSSKTADRVGRLHLQQVEHDRGNIDLKGVGDKFCVGCTGELTQLALSDEIRRIQRTKGIIWRERKEAIAEARVDYKTACRSAKTKCRTTQREAELAYARSVAGLLKVEQQARGVALDTYKQVMEQATSGLSNAYKSLLATRQRTVEEIEAKTRETLAVLDGQIDDLGVDIFGLTLDKVYKRIDIGFLRMKITKGDNVGLPLFAVFTPTQPKFQLHMRVTKKGGTNDVFEQMHCSRKSVQHVYSGFSQAMRGYINKHVDRQWYGYQYWDKVDVSLRVNAGFAGVIPDTVRKKIQIAQPDFDEILIVTEAPKWELQWKDKTVHPVPVGDPLVIGRKGKGFWLVDSFDTTAAEDYVRREFTSDLKK